MKTRLTQILGPPSRLAQVGHFLWHLVEMCLAMCVGGSILNVLVFWTAAQIGYPDLRQQFPELSLLVIAFNYSLPMAAWMRFRGKEEPPRLSAGECQSDLKRDEIPRQGNWSLTLTLLKE